MIVTIALGVMILLAAGARAALKGDYKLAGVAVGVLAALMVVATGLQSKEPVDEPGEQIVDVDLAQGSLNTDQQQMLNLLVAHGFTLKAVPIMVKDDQRVVVLVGDVSKKTPQQTEALKIALEQFALSAVENLSEADKAQLTGGSSRLNSVKRLFSKHADSDLVSYVLSRGYLIDGDLIRKGRDGAMPYAEAQESVRQSQKPVTMSLDAGSPLDGEASLAIEKRISRAAENVRLGLTRFPESKVILAVVGRSRVESVAKALRSQNPEGFFLKSAQQDDKTN
jgi:hypothetical protein